MVLLPWALAVHVRQVAVGRGRDGKGRAGCGQKVVEVVVLVMVRRVVVVALVAAAWVAGRSTRVSVHCNSMCGPSAPCSRSSPGGEAGERKTMRQLSVLPLSDSPW